MRIVMLTGDSRSTAEAVARQLGIDKAPALAQADVGIARGTGIAMRARG